MGYSNEPMQEQEKEALFQKYIQEWSNILNEYAYNRFGAVQPHQKFSACVSAFSHLPDVAKLYICGLLNDIQFVELSLACKQYHTEACQYAPQIENPENIEEVYPPSFDDVKDNLKDDLFHHPIMEDYLEIIDQIDWAAKIYDTHHLNMENDWICFDDMPSSINVLYSDNIHETDAFMINTLLSIRNGCVYITPDEKEFFNALVNRFCDDTLSVLLDVPENDLSSGVAERASFAHTFFSGLFNNSATVLTGMQENIMQTAINVTRTMLANQPYDKGWSFALLNWYDNITSPYLNSLANRIKPSKINSQNKNNPLDNSPQNDRE